MSELLETHDEQPQEARHIVHPAPHEGVEHDIARFEDDGGPAWPDQDVI